MFYKSGWYGRCVTMTDRPHLVSDPRTVGNQVLQASLGPLSHPNRQWSSYGLRLNPWSSLSRRSYIKVNPERRPGLRAPELRLLKSRVGLR